VAGAIRRRLKKSGIDYFPQYFAHLLAVLFLVSFANINASFMNESNTLSSDGAETRPGALETATLGGGCFWCVEAIFKDLTGVRSVVSGYSGGDANSANYKAVCAGDTRHAEVVQVVFDPKTITYQDILEIFWSTHDPTTLDRQGNDVGPQYRSVIFYHDEEQRRIAERSKAEVAPRIWDQPIVTEINPFSAFYPAEDYHQDYYATVGDRNPYCTIVISPKVKKFRQQFASKLKH
jgi:methionine-S-sulfoxide reductase